MQIRKVCGRIFALIIIFLILAAFAASYYAPQIITALKPEIESALGSVLKHKVQIASIEAQFWPKLGIRLSGVKIAEEDNCAAGIKMGQMLLQLDTRSLLTRKIDVDILEVESFEVNLARSDDGYYIDSSDASPCTAMRQATNTANSVSAQSGSVEQRAEFDLEMLKLISGKINLRLKDGSIQTFDDVDFEAALKIKENVFSFSALSLSFLLAGQTYAYSTPDVVIDSENLKYESSGGTLKIGKAEFKLGSELADNFSLKKLTVSANAVNLPQLLKSLPAPYREYHSAVKNVICDINLNLQTKSASQLEVSGELKLTSLLLPFLDIKAREVNAKNILLAFENGALKSVNSNISVKEGALVDGINKYAAAEISGPLSLSISKGTKNLTADLRVQSFLFQNDNTKVSKVSAELKKIVLKIMAGGKVEATTNLENGSLSLQAPNIDISSVDKISTQVTVKVRPGYYEVSGPINFSNGNFRSLGRGFGAASGAAQVFLSAALKQFDVKSITAQSSGQGISLVALFKMLPNRYELPRSIIKIGAGKLLLSGNADRTNVSMPFSAQLSAEAAEFAPLLRVIADNPSLEVYGNLDLQTTLLRGQFANLLPSLEAEGQFTHSKNTSKGFNLTQKIASAISEIPLVGVRIIPSDLSDTSERHISSASFSVKNQSAKISNLSAQRRSYELRGDGQIDFDGKLSGKASVIFLQQTMEMFGGGFSALGRLLGRLGRVSIPLNVSGKLPDVSISPDLKTLARDNTGITFIGSAVDTIGEIGTGIGDLVTSPFRKRSTPTPQP